MKITFFLRLTLAAGGGLMLAACAATPAAPLPSSHPASPLGQESQSVSSYKLAPDTDTQATSHLLDSHE